MIKTRYAAKYIIACGIILLLSGCGLHLQGMSDMPKWFNNVAIINQNVHNDLRPQIIEELKAYKLHITNNIQKADCWLVLEEDKHTENITAVSSSTTPRQYQMSYAIKYKVQRPNGEVIIPSNSAVVTRQFTINGNRILGSDFEGDLLRNEMYKDAVAQIVDHIENTKYVH